MLIEASWLFAFWMILDTSIVDYEATYFAAKKAKNCGRIACGLWVLRKC